jgi:hypothetical protein
MLNDSLVNHLNKYIDTELLLNPTSKNAIIANIVVNNILEHVNKRDPYTPTFLPKKPEIIEPNKGKKIIVKYIIYIL